jgi:hypothetical protein
MLPDYQTYEAYGRKLGREHRDDHGPIADWVGFLELKMNSQLRELRKLAGYSDRYGAGTYRKCDASRQTAYQALLSGFRSEATA